MESITIKPGSPHPKNVDYQSANPSAGLQSQTPTSLGLLLDTNLKRKHNEKCANLRYKLVNRRNKLNKENVDKQMKLQDPSIITIGNLPIKWIHDITCEASVKTLNTVVAPKSGAILGNNRDPIKARVKGNNLHDSRVINNNAAKAMYQSKNSALNEKYLPTKNMYDILEDSASTTDTEDDRARPLDYVRKVNHAEKRARKYNKDCGSGEISSDEELPLAWNSEIKSPYERSGRPLVKSRNMAKLTDSVKDIVGRIAPRGSLASISDVDSVSCPSGNSSDLEGRIAPRGSLASIDSDLLFGASMVDAACGDSDHDNDSLTDLTGDHLMVHNFLHIFDFYTYNQFLMTDWSNLDHVSDIMSLIKPRNLISFEEFARCVMVARKPWNRFIEDDLYPLFSTHPLFVDAYREEYVLDLLEQTYKNGYPSCVVKTLGLNELPNVHLCKSREEIKYPKKVIDNYYSSLDTKVYGLGEPNLNSERIMLALRSYSGLDDQLQFDTWKKRGFKKKVKETMGVGSQCGTDAATNVAMDPESRFNYKSLPRDIENSEMDIQDRKNNEFCSGNYVTSNGDRPIKWKPKLYKKNTELLYFLKLKYFMSSRSPGMIPSMVQDARAFVNKNELVLNKDMYVEITNTIMQAFLLDSQELTFRSLMKNTVALDAISHLNDTNSGNLGKTFIAKRYNANSLCTKIKHAATCMVTQNFPDVDKPLKI